MYKHHWFSGETINLPVGKAVCVGRNYAAHASELNNPVPEQPLLFIKPQTAFQQLTDTVSLPRPGLHFETELALLIGAQLSAEHSHDPFAAVTAVSLGLDLTDRDMQQQLKDKGHPWERAKAFDGALPLGSWLPINQLPQDPSTWAFRLELNGELRQHGEVRDMLFPIPDLLREIVQSFRLEPGDVVLTGTPAGVGVLSSGDRLSLRIDDTDWRLDSTVE